MFVLDFPGGMEPADLLQALLVMDAGNAALVREAWNGGALPLLQPYLEGLKEAGPGAIPTLPRNHPEQEQPVNPTTLNLPEATWARDFRELFYLSGEKALAPFDLFLYLSILIILDKYSISDTLRFFLPIVGVASSARTFNLLKGCACRLKAEGRELPPLLAALLAKFSRFIVGELAVELVLCREFPGSTGAPIRFFKCTPVNQEYIHRGQAGEEDEVAVLETNIDDMTPEILASAMETVLAEGALDYVVLPAGMKKNRMGFQIQVLCKPEDADNLMECLFRWTSTFGVRQTRARREILERTTESVQTSLGVVRIKTGLRGGKIVRRAPEFDDLVKISRKTGISTQDIYTIICKELKIEQDCT